MERRHIGFAILAVVLVGLAIFAILAVLPPAGNQEGSRAVVAGQVVITDYWVAASIPGQMRSAAYLTIRNAADAEERLLGAATPAAGMTHLHRTVVEDGISRMGGVDAVILPPQGEVRFAPGGLHIMLMAMPEPFAEGETVPLTLSFLESGEITFDAPVRNRADMLEME